MTSDLGPPCELKECQSWPPEASVLLQALSSHLTPHRLFQYCHYVAGLVGIGLSRLFSNSGLEDPLCGQDTLIANSMGLFLQKTNIIRDFLEDLQDGRVFWPKEVRASRNLDGESLEPPGET